MPVSDDILPRYQRLPGGAGPGSGGRPFRCRETHLFLAIGATIAVICFGTIFFMPDLSESLRRMESLNRVQKRVQDTAEGLLLPPPPHAEPDAAGGAAPGHAGQIEDPHLALDRQKLYEKVRSAGALPPPPLAKPRQGAAADGGDAGDADNVDVDEPLPAAAAAAVPGMADGRGGSGPPAGPTLPDGEDRDPVARQRRHTIKQVSH